MSLGALARSLVAAALVVAPLGCNSPTDKRGDLLNWSDAELLDYAVKAAVERAPRPASAEVLSISIVDRDPRIVCGTMRVSDSEVLPFSLMWGERPSGRLPAPLLPVLGDRTVGTEPRLRSTLAVVEQICRPKLTRPGGENAVAPERQR